MSKFAFSRIWIALILCFGWGHSWAAPLEHHTRASLLLSAEAARPGDTILAGVRLEMDPGWHTYWKNPGTSGMATKIDWDLPAGVTAGEILWPLPEKLTEAGFTTYAYTREVVLLVPLTLSKDVAPGTLPLKAAVSWLECQELCLPGDAQISAALPVGQPGRPSASAALLASWAAKTPDRAGAPRVTGSWESSADSDTRQLALAWPVAGGITNPEFYPFENQDYEIEGDTRILKSSEAEARLAKAVKKLEGNWPAEVSGVVSWQADGKQVAYEVSVPVNSPASASGMMSGPVFPPLWRILIYAFIGGLILNVMPCVLPVIALKILGFVEQARKQPREVRVLGLMYGVGVLASFLAIAALFLGLKAAGHTAGWGIQFSNPQFLVVLTTVMTLVALNLFGVFEVTPGGKVMGAAGALAAKTGRTGAFLNGILATVLATPCVAPFFAGAAGFALAPNQKSALTVLVFLVAGAGLAFPYVLLSWQPAWLRFVPKPGKWMERFKVAMGFPMLATAVWLFSLTTIHYGNRTWWLAIFLVLVAAAAWTFGEFIQRGRSRRGLALLASVMIAGFAVVYVLEGQLAWRTEARGAGARTAQLQTAGGIPWQPWSPEAVAAARAEGRPVFVDFTADWCLTCQANKKVAIEIPSVREKLKQMNAVALLADYTLLPERMTAELNRFGRAGVPLVVVYPVRTERPPEVLPAALTPGIVLGALERAVP